MHALKRKGTMGLRRPAPYRTTFGTPEYPAAIADLERHLQPSEHRYTILSGACTTSATDEERPLFTAESPVLLEVRPAYALIDLLEHERIHLFNTPRQPTARFVDGELILEIPTLEALVRITTPGQSHLYGE